MKWAVIVAVASGASVASAAPRTAQLSFSGEACSAQELVDRVHDLVGRDPFSTDAPLQIDVRIEAGPRATVTIAGRGQRELVASTCGELMDALALVIAIDISGDQPTVLESTPSPTTDAPPVMPSGPSTVGVAARDVATPPANHARVDSELARVATAYSRPEAEPPWVVSLVGGVAANIRGTPSGSVGARLARGWWSIEGVVGVGAPETHPMVDVIRGGVAIVGCVHVGPASACPIASAGWVMGRGHDLTRAETATTPAASGGMRLAAEHRLGGGFGLRARIDGTVSVTSTTFTVDDSMVWASPRGELLFGIDMLAQIP